MSALALQNFGFGDQLVRVVDREGAAWFVANDVCAVLEITNPRDAVRRLEEDERDGVGITDAIGREQQMTIVSESGVFALIFRSRKPAARAFRKWVTSEVLPSIRRTGSFLAEAPANDEDDGHQLQRLPETPDEFDLLRARLQLVREARIAFGPRAARRAWEWAGLPKLAAPTLALGCDGDETIVQKHPSIIAWLDAKCEADPGSRVATMQLYNAYKRWLASEGRTQELSTVKAFAMVLEAHGFTGHKGPDGFRFRKGVKLRD